MNEPVVNTDKEIWREISGDYYSPSIHVTESGSIGINVGGHVYVKSVEEWHKQAKQRKPLSEEEVIQTFNEIWNAGGSTNGVLHRFTKAIEKRHGIE